MDCNTFQDQLPPDNRCKCVKDTGSYSNRHQCTRANRSYRLPGGHFKIHLTNLIILSTFTIITQVAAQMDNEIMRFNGNSNTRQTEPALDADVSCDEYSYLNEQQQSICTRYPHATASAVQGLKLSLHECRRQFHGHRWNCSHLDESIANSHQLLQTGYKEASFTYALAAAGVLHQIARACSLGKIAACGCEAKPVSNEFEWQGCSHDLGFGAKYSRKFLQSLEDEYSIPAVMQTHNSKVGRKAVIAQKSTKCKCHGLSTSCEIKTCWLSAPDFNKVGDRLKSLYENSVLVEQRNLRRQLTLDNQASIQEDAVTRYERGGNLNKKMVHFERSPTYCDAIPSLNLPGTTGRVCNSTTSEDISSCSALCCGRGYFTVKVRRVEKCDCEFHWCCYVVCQECAYDEWVTVCK